MRTLIYVSIFLFINGFSQNLFAYTVVVLQGNDSSFGRKYFSGFSSLATEKITAFRYEQGNKKAIVKKIRKTAPDLIFTIGNAPIRSLSKHLPSTPLIIGNYNYASIKRTPNMLFMETDTPIAPVLTLAQMAFPSKKTVGTIYDPKYSQPTFDELVRQTTKLGLKIASIKVDSAADVREFLPAFSGKIDLFYYLEDPTTSSKSAESATLAFLKNNNIPFVSLNPDHIQNGALLTVNVNPFELGEGAWKIAIKILKTAKIPQDRKNLIGPNELTTSLSLQTLSRFGIGSEKLFTLLQRATKKNYNIQIRP